MRLNKKFICSIYIRDLKTSNHSKNSSLVSGSGDSSLKTSCLPLVTNAGDRKCSSLDLCTVFDTTDHIILLVCLKLWVATLVLTTSLKQNIHCLYRNKSSRCRGLHSQGCSFSHYIFFSVDTYPSMCGNPSPSCASPSGQLIPCCL